MNRKQPELYWTNSEDISPGRIAIASCPPGGLQLEVYMESLKTEEVDILVSLLEIPEAKLLDLEREGESCRSAGMEFLWMPVADHSVPASIEEFTLVIERLGEQLRAGKTVVAHCYAGIGRSCILLAALLCSMGISAEQACARLSDARGFPVPESPTQMEWVKQFADRLKTAEPRLK